MWTCSNCGLVNTDESRQCDCGRAAAASRNWPDVPLIVWLHLGLVIVLTLYIAFGPYGYVTRPPRRYTWEQSEAQQQFGAALFFVRTVALVPLYALFLKERRNWARIAIGILTFPLGLLVLMARSAREYTGAIAAVEDGAGSVLGINENRKDG